MTPAALFPSMLASCILSDCRRYRYTLRIPLSSAPGVCLFVMANPSTAIVDRGAFTSDPTVTRCIVYARKWGYGTLIVENVRAWRETDPDLVPEDPLAIGPENDLYIQRSAVIANLIVCGWGKLGGERGRDVLRMLAPLKPHALHVNKDGSPGHPLYLRADAKPFAMEGT